MGLRLRWTFYLLVSWLVQSVGQPVPPVMVRQALSDFNYAEYMPLVSADGAQLLFTRNGHPANYGLQDRDDIWAIYMQEDGSWSRPVNAGAPNTEADNQALGISLRKDTLYVWASNEAGQKQIARTVRAGRNWGEPQPMTIEGWTEDVEITHWHISFDGKILLLSAIHPSGRGEEDLYVAFRVDKDRWSEPLNLGTTINSPSREASVFLAADGRSLYFASDRKGGFGGLDLYVSRKQNGDWTDWSKPLNLGPEINTAGDEYQISMPASGDWSIFVGASDSGKAGLFQAVLPLNLQPSSTILFTGQVQQAINGSPLNAAVYYYALDEEGRPESKDTLLVGREGKFYLLLPRSKNIGIFAEHPQYFSGSYYLVSGGIWQEKLDGEPAFMSALAQHRPEYLQREAGIERLQLEYHKKSLLIQSLEQARLLEAERIFQPGEPEGPIFSGTAGNAEKITQLRSRYEATREQYLKDWIQHQEWSLRGDSDPGDPYSLYSQNKVYPKTAEGRIESLREKKEARAQQAAEASQSGTPAQLLEAPPASFEQFAQDLQKELREEMLLHSLRQLERDQLPFAAETLRKQLADEGQLAYFQELFTVRLRKLEDTASTATSFLAQTLDWTPPSPKKLAVNHSWQEVISDELKTILRPAVERQMQSALKPAVRTFLECDLNLALRVKERDDLDLKIRKEIQVQFVAEKSMRQKFQESLAVLPDNQDTVEVRSNSEISREVLLYPIYSTGTIPLENIFFQPNTAELLPVSYLELDRLLVFLRNHPDIGVEIGVHANGNCSHFFALEISGQRAKMLNQYFVNEGIEPHRILSKGFGRYYPLASNETVEGRRQNQRIEVRFFPLNEK